ncbi:hypothetical protein GGH95_005931, partial [Coemansia sp. RSA 1836]
MSGSEQSRDMLGQDRIRRFEFGTEDEDLEAMQRDFLKNSSKPAARAISQGRPPVVAASASGQKQPRAAREPKPAASGDVLGFAKSMSAAMDEFESSERLSESSKQSNRHQQQTLAQPKKLSVFAQRRLAQQTNSESSSCKQAASSSGSRGAPHSEATFLPKLMAPVPEHEVVGPVRAPELKPRETGFPSIPVDFTA